MRADDGMPDGLSAAGELRREPDSGMIGFTLYDKICDPVKGDAHDRGEMLLKGRLVSTIEKTVQTVVLLNLSSILCVDVTEKLDLMIRFSGIANPSRALGLLFGRIGIPVLK